MILSGAPAMLKTNRLAFVLADREVREALNNLRNINNTPWFTMEDYVEGHTKADERAAAAILAASDRWSSTEGPKKVSGTAEVLQPHKIVGSPQMTAVPDSVREEAALALYEVCRKHGILRDDDICEEMVDAVAPLLEAPLRTEIARLTARLAEVEGALDLEHRLVDRMESYMNRDARNSLAEALGCDGNGVPDFRAALSLEAPRE